MGNEFSEPTVMQPELGYVGIVLRSPGKVRLLHAPSDVVHLTKNVIREVEKRVGNESPVETKEKYGAIGLKLSDWCFEPLKGEKASTMGKIFTILM